MTLESFQIDKQINAGNVLTSIAQHESFNDHVSIDVWLNGKLINRVSLPYESIKLIVTTVEARKFSEGLSK